MNRYRIRFLLQEIDLAPGETLIGRSSSCHVSLVDPLVSRRHARLRVEEQGVYVEDMGSRNGVLVNGRRLDGAVRVDDGDRLRIGSHELVVCRATVPAVRRRAHTPATGFKWRCGACGTLYPANLDACPDCGTETPQDEDTLTDIVHQSEEAWSLELLAQVFRRALSLQRWGDLARVMDRARVELGSRLESAISVGGLLDDMATGAAQLAAEGDGFARLGWVLELHEKHGSLPQESLLERLGPLGAQRSIELTRRVRAMVDAHVARAQQGESGAVAQERLDCWQKWLADAVPTEPRSTRT